MATGLNRIKNPNAAKALGLGKHADGGGLHLYHTKAGRSWVMRYTLGGKRHELGLGSFDAVALAGARQKAAGIRAMLERGGDPKAELAAQKHAVKASIDRNAPEAQARRSLSNVIDRTFDAHKKSLKGGGEAGRWRSPLDTHVIPKLGRRDVETIAPQDVADTLRPIWHEKADVARKAMQRLGKALAYARAEGFDVRRDVTADARDILGRQLRTPKNIPAMNWKQVPEYYATLGNGSVDLCLRLLILTGVRSRPARFANVDQIDGDLWTIPAHLMKGSAQQAQNDENDFDVPLSTEAVEVVEAAKVLAIDGQLFTGPRGKVISDMSMSAKMRRDGLDSRPHGFRASFRTWADEETRASYEAKETALAHKVGSAIERSYARSNLLDQRRTLLNQWAAYVTRREDSLVVPLRRQQ